MILLIEGIANNNNNIYNKKFMNIKNCREK